MSLGNAVLMTRMMRTRGEDAGRKPECIGSSSQVETLEVQHGWVLRFRFYEMGEGFYGMVVVLVWDIDMGR